MLGHLRLSTERCALITMDKVSKKKQKALAFRKPKGERDEEKAKKEEKKAKKEEAKAKKIEPEPEAKSEKRKASEDPESEAAEEPKKKRKTRRGKKGKGVNDGHGPRFILFVGNLPYDTQPEELTEHFKKAGPDRVRVRREKGIGFLEFDNDSKVIQAKMEHALKMHHTMFRNRKINVELTVGGGGNSETRQQKLKDKNEKLQDERKQRLKKLLEKKQKEQKDKPASGMHPARAAMLNQ